MNLINYEGVIYFTYNMFDQNIKECHFNILSDVPLGYEQVKDRACEQCQTRLNLAQCIKSIVYREVKNVS